MEIFLLYLFSYFLIVLTGISLLKNMELSVYLGVFLVAFLGFFSSCLLIMYYSNVFGFLFYLLFYYYFIGVCIFSNEREKGCGSRWKGKWGVTGRSRGRGNYIQNILIKIYFNKRK